MAELAAPSAFVHELLDVLESRFGHDLTTRQLARTLAGAGFIACDAQPERLNDYLTLLRTLPIEAPLVQALVQPAMNNESYFFRDPATVATLREHILPPLIAAAASTRVFRAWSAGCSTGEELYTLSILLHEMLPDYDDWTIALVGTDIDGGALVHARSARFAEWSLRATTQEQRQRYFQRDAATGRYLLQQRYRRNTSFSLHNLVDAEAPPPAPGSFDLVLCRNVAIYLTPIARSALDRKLSSALSGEGCWISGPSDPVPSCGGLEMQVLPGLLVHRRAAAGASRQRASAEARRQLVPIQTMPVPLRTSLRVASPVAKPAASSWTPPSLPPLPALPSIPPQADAAERKQALADQLALARWHADRNDLIAAHELVDDVLAEDAMIVSAYLLRADLFEAQNNGQAALEALRCAVYLDPQLLEAHFRIGLALERRGDRRGAIVALRNAAALGRTPDDSATTGLAQLAAMRMTLLLTEEAHERR